MSEPLVSVVAVADGAMADSAVGEAAGQPAVNR